MNGIHTKASKTLCHLESALIAPISFSIRIIRVKPITLKPCFKKILTKDCVQGLMAVKTGMGIIFILYINECDPLLFLRIRNFRNTYSYSFTFFAQIYIEKYYMFNINYGAELLITEIQNSCSAVLAVKLLSIFDLKMLHTNYIKFYAESVSSFYFQLKSRTEHFVINPFATLWEKKILFWLEWHSKREVFHVFFFRFWQ